MPRAPSVNSLVGQAAIASPGGRLRRLVDRDAGVAESLAAVERLPMMELDPTKPTCRHAGRDYRLTDVPGSVVQEILA